MTRRVLVPFLAVAMVGCASARYAEVSADAQGSGGDLVGKRVQGSLPILGSYELMDLTKYQGHTVAMMVWNSGTLASRDALPFFTSLAEQYRNRALIVGINVDSDYREAEETKQRFALNFPILRDAGGELTRGMGLTELPSTVIMDVEGRVVAIHKGYDERVASDIVASLEEGIRLSSRRGLVHRARGNGASLAASAEAPAPEVAPASAQGGARVEKASPKKKAAKGKASRKARRNKGRR